MFGAPGSGKSIVARLLSKSITAIVIDHDPLRSFFPKKDMPFEQSVKLSYRFQWKVAEDFIKQERNVIVDSTFNYKETHDQGRTLAQHYGCEYKCIECRVDDIQFIDERLRSRVPQRSQRTGVNLPPADAHRDHCDEDFHALFQNGSSTHVIRRAILLSWIRRLSKSHS
jgi:predicted kinase